ncbi:MULTISPECIES: hypothetical protein [Candidatus Neomicrothrix]|uniref:Uncharacterized protein n=1 Tax=Candidatus Neomicrothrix parvicella RN1 TaxID=1229780 RepID=R4Z2N7_9ACTN|nr:MULTISPECIES: hypothetical protein [Microthrix]CCM63551.1 hypothetical protein BN381_250044 [Candidatus Microthrix parvicella RN1]
MAIELDHLVSVTRDNREGSHPAILVSMELITVPWGGGAAA